MTPTTRLSVPADSIVIEIGNTAIALDTADAAFRHLLEERYAPFLNSSRNVHSQITIHLIENPNQGDLTTAEPDEDLQVKMDGGRWILKRGDFRAEWNPATGVGGIRQALNPYSVDTVLRIVHSLILAQEGGFLLHAASAVKGGSAFLFSGVSGAGKTTISRLAPSDVILLTDEISYIKPEGGTYRAFGTPFAGELAKLGENISAPVSTVFLLEKGPENKIEAVPPDEAIRRLLRNILFFAEDSELVNLVFQSACRFCQKVPVRKLVFAPDERVWEIIGLQE
jgi:hypothetical protein